MNIVKMQEMLKSVPEATLVQYVQNPGQVPAYLALSEIQRRKQMRAEAATQAQAPQTSVAEQMTSPQQPMNMGIASLPASESVGDESAYANGGIVAFADGGATDPYWAEQERAERERGVYGAVASDWFNQLVDVPNALRRYLSGGYYGGVAPEPTAPAEAEAYANWLRTRNNPPDASAYERLKKVQIPNEFADSTKEDIFKRLNAVQIPNEFAGSGSSDVYNRRKQVQIPNEFDDERIRKTAAFLQRDAAINEPKLRKAKQGADKTPVPPRAPVAKPTATPATGIAALQYSPVTVDESAYVERPEVGAQARMEEMQKLYGVDPARAQLAERMSNLEKRAAETERQAPWQALTKAGFAMASGSSPYWMQNLGKGATAGLEDYSKSRDKLQELEEKRFDMAQRIAQAERNEQIAAATYGEQSAERDKAANEAIRLHKQSDKLHAQTANAKGDLDAKQANLNAQLRRDELASQERRAKETIAVSREANARIGVSEEKARMNQQTAILNNMLDESRNNLEKMRSGLIVGVTPEQIASEEARYNQLMREMARIANINLPTPAPAITPGANKLVQTGVNKYIYPMGR